MTGDFWSLLPWLRGEHHQLLSSFESVVEDRLLSVKGMAQQKDNALSPCASNLLLLHK